MGGMLDPHQAPEALSEVFRRIEDEQTDADHAPHLWLSPVVPANGSTAVGDQMIRLAQSSLDKSHGPHSILEFRGISEPEQWWQVFHHEVTEGLLAPRGTRHLIAGRTHPPDGDLVLVAADLIEVHLGPVRHSARIVFDCHTCSDVASRDLLLVSDAWATVLHLGVND